MRLSTLADRSLALILFLIAVTLAVAAVLLPVRAAHRHYDDAIAGGIDRMARYTRAASVRDDVNSAVEKYKGISDEEYLLHGGTESLLAAELQTLVTRLVEANNGKLISSQVPQITAPAVKGDDLTRAAISVQLNASAPTLQLTLHAIENHRPFLFVDQLVVRSPHGRSTRPQPGVEPEFNVQITVSAFARIGSVR